MDVKQPPVLSDAASVKHYFHFPSSNMVSYITYTALQRERTVEAVKFTKIFFVAFFMPLGWLFYQKIAIEPE